MKQRSGIAPSRVPSPLENDKPSREGKVKHYEGARHNGGGTSHRRVDSLDSAGERPVNPILDLRHLDALLVQPLRFQRNVHADVSPCSVFVGKAVQVVLVPGVPVAAAVT